MNTTTLNLPDEKKLLRNFSRCLNWEEKYLYLIELGEKLAPLSSEYRQSENLISGCQSQVWIKLEKNEMGQIQFYGDSDAAIVKGLLAVVFGLYKNLTADEIIKKDVISILKELAFDKHLTASRTQGLDSMLRSIRRAAATFA